MFLKSLQTLFYPYPVHRKNFFFKTLLPLQLKFSKLLFFKKWGAGRGARGKIVLRSKGKRSYKYRMPFINFSFRLTFISFFIGYFFLPYKQKLCGIFYLSSGQLTHTQLTTNNTPTLFTLLQFQPLDYKISFKLKEVLLSKPFLKVTSAYSLLLMLKKNTPVSLLELYPLRGVQYVRSPGSKATILKMDTRTGYSLVRLPSGIKKIFSIFSLTSPGLPNLAAKNKYGSLKAGTKVRYGLKPRVRGVAMNPVDHPHGGRTKAIKYPRTPWGKTTKYK